MSLIHKFMQGDQRFVIDINSGSIHSIDEVVYAILAEEDKVPAAEGVKSRLADKYNLNDLEEALRIFIYLMKLDVNY